MFSEHKNNRCVCSWTDVCVLWDSEHKYQFLSNSYNMSWLASKNNTHVHSCIAIKATTFTKPNWLEEHSGKRGEVLFVQHAGLEPKHSSMWCVWSLWQNFSDAEMKIFEIGIKVSNILNDEFSVINQFNAKIGSKVILLFSKFVELIIISCFLFSFPKSYLLCYIAMLTLLMWFTYILNHFST